MKSYRHWTLRYIKDRIALWFYQKQHPDYPWLTRTATEILSSWLLPSDIGFEWGSGMSTMWLALRIHELTSIEHDLAWYQYLKERLEKNQINNVNLMSCKIENGAECEYVKVINNWPAHSFDFVLVDGKFRRHCVEAALEKLRGGGLLILDNANRYLPSDSPSPSSVRVYPEKKWQDLVGRLNDWRRIRTSNGVFDTVLWIKPHL